MAVGPINLANPEKTYYTYYSLQQWGKHGKSGFLGGGGSSNMMTIAKKYLSNPEKVTNSEKLDYDENRKNTLLIRKKTRLSEKNVLHLL